MPRLAGERTTPLTPAEIVVEALRQFDAGPGEPTIRSLAGALGVAPAAIYHHYPSQAAIWRGAVQAVWREASTETLSLVPEPFASEPVEVLVAVGLATRRTWLRHHRLSRHMVAGPGAAQVATDALGRLGGVFEAMGMSGEEAEVAFRTYATFMLGAVLFAAAQSAPADPRRDEDLFVAGLRRLVENLGPRRRRGGRGEGAMLLRGRATPPSGSPQ